MPVHFGIQASSCQQPRQLESVSATAVYGEMEFEPDHLNSAYLMFSVHAYMLTTTLYTRQPFISGSLCIIAHCVLHKPLLSGESVFVAHLINRM